MASTMTLPSTSTSSSPTSIIHPKPKAMSLTQTYQLAHLARAKLSHEAGRAEHRLHRLVGHANLLDSLMLDLQAAEREQEQWFNETVKKAAASAAASASASVATTPSEPRRVQWADRLMAEEVEAAVAELEESDESEDESEEEEDEDEFDSDYEMDNDFVELVRVPSHKSLVVDSPLPSTTHTTVTEIEVSSSSSSSSSDSDESASSSPSTSPSSSPPSPSLHIKEADQDHPKDEDDLALHDLSNSLSLSPPSSPQTSTSSCASCSSSPPSSPTMPDLELDDSASESDYDEEDDDDHLMPPSPREVDMASLRTILPDLRSPCERYHATLNGMNDQQRRELVTTAYYTVMTATAVATSSLPTASTDRSAHDLEMDITAHHHHDYHAEPTTDSSSSTLSSDALATLANELRACAGVAVY